MMKTLLKIMLLFVVIFSGMLAIVQNAEGGDMYLNTIQYNTNSLQADWEDWRSKYVTTRDAGAAPRMRVLHGINSSTTVSEGQAYGMLFATVFDEQTLFDGFYLYARDYFNDRSWLDELANSRHICFRIWRGNRCGCRYGNGSFARLR